MSDVRPTIRVVDRANPVAVRRPSDALTSFSAAATGIDDGRELLAELCGHDGELYAGVHNWSWAETCWIELLWIRDDQRGRGTGTALMHAVQAEARSRGCTQVALMTHSPGPRLRPPTHGFEQVGNWRTIPRVTPTCCSAAACTDAQAARSIAPAVGTRS